MRRSGALTKKDPPLNNKFNVTKRKGARQAQNGSHGSQQSSLTWKQKLQFLAAFLLVFWVSVTLYILRSSASSPSLGEEESRHHGVHNALFNRLQQEHHFLMRGHATAQDKEHEEGLLRHWMKPRAQLRQVKQKKQQHDVNEANDKDIVHPKRGGGVKNDLLSMWSQKRLFHQRLGGYKQPTVSVEANLKHNTDKVDFKGFNTTLKEIDMRTLNQILPFDNPDGGAWKQGWNVHATTKKLKIYVLPHSHCDPGWIKTFDDYFQQQTKEILTTIMDALQKDKRRKFIWAEISYFEWWWREQTPEIQDVTRKLLKNGQLEFVTGGWVQPDEANTQLYAMEIQLQEGHDFIKATFGEEYVPRYGWSIDPFGYSPTMAYLLKKYNFQAMLIQRVHYAIKKELASRHHLEFNWRQTWDASQEHDIFTHVMPFFSYDVPHTCGPDPSVCCQFDFARQPVGRSAMSCPWRKPPRVITDDNVNERAMLLLDQYKKKAALYRGNSVLIPLGDDFRYQTPTEAENQYTNYQKIFDYINKYVDGVSIQFGTLSEYFKDVMGTFDTPVLKGSFFTYADVNEDYWSGYFTSRIFDKALDRKLERVLYAAETMGASKQEMQIPRRALSLFQHHDGVTGTARTNVVQDYAQRIHSAINQVQDYLLSKIQTDFFPKASNHNIQACWKSDAPRGLSQNLCGNNREGAIVYVYNPLNTTQTCGSVKVRGHKAAKAKLPCEVPGPLPRSTAGIKFDAKTGLMTWPVQEHWMVWNVDKGGAYLFHPGTLSSFNAEEVEVSHGGYVVSTPNWKRRVIERQVPADVETTSGKGTTTVIDFVYETNLQASNEEWFARFYNGDIQNSGVFHTDLNGFNFDTHHFRSDMPIQSQVFPMPTLASIEDDEQRMTVLSEHAQGTASLRDGTIDVWLDRRLGQDDSRGLFQGVTDNVPTRTRLRLVLEKDGYETNGSREFRPTPTCRRMWDELNHPLEMFGTHSFPSAQEAAEKEAEEDAKAADAAEQDGEYDLLPGASIVEMIKKELVIPENEEQPVESKSSNKKNKGGVTPFVFMVYKRVDYFKRAVESLRNSDFDKSATPLIVSMDGHVEEMVEYVDSLRSEFSRLVVLTHPYSCHDHPDTFPGNDESLNENYAGDTYGNKRSGWATCAKHHFSWMLHKVFQLDIPNSNAFVFLEEDYVLAPTIQETINAGLFLLGKLKQHKHNFFGVCLDPTEGHSRRMWTNEKEGWATDIFKSGPMAITREMFLEIQKSAKEYCNFDDYNWDWSLIHLMGRGLLPAQVIVPSVPQALHIGATEGMHADTNRQAVKILMDHTEKAKPFHGKKLYSLPSFYATAKTHDAGFGGWAHPADVSHCIKVMTETK